MKPEYLAESVLRHNRNFSLGIVNPEKLSRSIKVPARLPAIAELCQKVNQLASEIGVDERQRATMELVLVEYTNNICQHGVSDKVAKLTKEDEILVYLEDCDEEFNLVVRDYGRPFPDAFFWEMMEHNAGSEQYIMPETLSEKGRGLPIIAALIHDYSYCRTNQENVFSARLAKKNRAPQSSQSQVRTPITRSTQR